MAELAKMLILLGAALIVAGVVILVLQKTSFLGKLPGDILIKRERFAFYFPLATSILLSIIISLILYLINRLR